MPGMSKINIAQQACIEAGGIQPITSFDEGSAAALAIDERYETIVRKELENHPWRWATTARQATHQADAPATTWSAAYEVDGAMLNIRRVYLDDRETTKWDRFGSRMVYLDGDANSVVFTEGVYRALENEWPAAFQNLIVLLIAMPLARHVARDVRMADTILEEINTERAIAKHTDSIQQPARQLPATGFIARRL